MYLCRFCAHQPCYMSCCGLNKEKSIQCIDIETHCKVICRIFRDLKDTIYHKREMNDEPNGDKSISNSI